MPDALELLKTRRSIKPVALEANRLTYPLFDTDRFRRHVEAGYTTMWEMWEWGEAPRISAVNGLPPAVPSLA